MGQGGGTVPSVWLAAWRQMLEFVQGLQEAALYHGLVAGELRESVALIGMLREACLSSVELAFCIVSIFGVSDKVS